MDTWILERKYHKKRTQKQIKQLEDSRYNFIDR